MISVWDLVEGSRDTLRARGEALEQIPWVSEPAEAGTVAWRARQAAHGAVGGRIWRTVVSAEFSALTHLTRRHRVGPGPTR